MCPYENGLLFSLCCWLFVWCLSSWWWFHLVWNSLASTPVTHGHRTRRGLLCIRVTKALSSCCTARLCTLWFSHFFTRWLFQQLFIWCYTIKYRADFVSQFSRDCGGIYPGYWLLSFYTLLLFQHLNSTALYLLTNCFSWFSFRFSFPHTHS